MQTPTLTDPRLEIAETLFEFRAETRYSLARPCSRHLLSPAQHERFERLLFDMEGNQSALEELPG